MSFGKKYFSSYKSNNNLDYYLEIFVANYSGSATEISLGKGGCVITYETDQEDRFSPILSSQCELPFLVQNTLHQSFIKDLRNSYQERQIYLHLYRATSSTYSSTKPLWSGFLVMDLGDGEDVSFPYVQKLTFVDGLALLKDIDFVDLSDEDFEDRVMGNYAQQNMYFGPAKYTFWIKEILLKSGCATTSQGSTQDYGFTTAINWYNGSMPNTNQNFDPFGNTQCIVSMFHTKNDQEVFTPDNCYNVLKELLRHWGARITYWKHEFWIVQIPEYIQDESGLIDNPDNINSRQYNKSGTLLGSQDHLGDTYYTRYEQTIANNQISKLVGTKYNYLPILNRASADFLSFASKNYYGGFPYGTNATSQEIYQGTIIDPSSANFLFLSIPLNWVWDLSNSNITQHTGGWWCSIKFNFYATNIDSLGNITEYYLQYEQTTGTYYWVLKADWSPIVKSPKYIIKSRNNVETNYIGFQEQIPFVDASGSAITMNGAWSFYLDIEDYATQNGGSFFCRFSGYNNYSGTVVQRNPQVSILLPNPNGSGTTSSGTVSWSNTLQDPTQTIVPSTNVPVTFNAGTAQQDIQLITNSAFQGFLQTLNTTQNASFGNQVVTTINNSNNSEEFNFGTLIWGDAVLQSTIGALRVYNGSTFVKTNPSGEWGRGTLSGSKTFTEILIDEFLSGQIKVVISPTMRLAVGEQNKNQTATGTSGPATRPRYVNPIGRLRETRSNETDPEYIFRRGSFFTLHDEWDYEGYQIIRDTVNATTTTNDLGGLGGAQDDAPLSNARMQGPVTNALMMNAPVAYLRTTVASTGSNVSVNGNFNVATGWTLGSGWSIDTTISKAKFTATGSTSDLVQDVLELEKTYKISFRVEVTAGTLTVKAGTTGGSQAITSTGDYIIYKQCLGNTQIKFQAGTTFTGTLTFVRIEEQKSLTEVPIEPLDNAVFKTGDTFNLINSNSGEIMELNVTSNQSAGDNVINVTSTALTDDINIGSIVLINQDDLSAQYQNKTKGTVGGFDITANSIDSGSVSIQSYIDDDTFATASATSLATSESIKAYVDTQVGTADTLQEVTDNGNTTTNSIMIGSSSSPLAKLQVTAGSSGVSSIDAGTSTLIESNTTNYLRFANPDANVGGLVWTSPSDNFGAFVRWGHNTGLLEIATANSSDSITFATGNASEKMRLTSTGLGIGTSSPSEILNLAGNNPNIRIDDTSAASRSELNSDISWYDSTGAQGSYIGHFQSANLEIRSKAGDVSIGTFAGTQIYIDGSKIGIGTVSPAEKLHVVGDALITGDSHADAFKPAVSGNPIKFKTFDSTERVQITNDGDLRITTPHINGNYRQISWVNQYVGLYRYYNNLMLSGYDSIQFKVSGADIYSQAEKARITSSGNLLIGTTSGTELLEIHDIATPTIKLVDTTNNANVTLNVGNFDATLASSGRVFVQSSTALSISTAGNVGVGIASPVNAKFEVVGNSIFDTATFSGQVTIPATPVASTDAASKGYVDAQIGANNDLQEVTDNGASTTNSIMIGSSSSPSEKLEVYSNGSNVAIKIHEDAGTHQAKLHLRRGGSDWEIINDNHLTIEGEDTERLRIVAGTGNLLINRTSDAGSRLQVDGEIRVYNANYDVNSDGYGYRFGAGDCGIFHTGYNMTFKNYNGSSLVENMRLDSSGKLLINATSTAFSDKLYVNSDAYTTGGWRVGSGATFVGKMFNSSGKLTIQSDSHRDLQFGDSNNADIMYIDTSAQKIGIATATPSEKLHVNGNVLVQSSSAGAFTIQGGTGVATTGAFVLRQNGDGSGNGIAITSSFATSHRIWKNSSGDLNIGTSASPSQLVQKVNGNLLLNTTTDDGSSKLQVDGSAKISDTDGSVAISGGNINLTDSGGGTMVTLDSSTGDGIVRWKDNNVQKWDMGRDNTDQAFVIANEAGLNDNQVVHINHSTGEFTLKGDLTIGEDDTGYDVTFYGDTSGQFLQWDASDNRLEFKDDVKAIFGTNNDANIHHNNTDFKISTTTGDLIITNSANDKDIEFRTDNGTGGTTSYITLDGSQTTVNVSQNLLINTTTDVGVPLYVNGVIRAVGGGIQAAQDYGFTLNDESGSNRYGLKFGAAGVTGGSNLLMLTNRSFNSATGGGEVAIGGNTNTSGVTEVEIARFIPRVTATSGTQKKVSLDAVLELTEQTAPADPASGESIIWMDSESGDLKVKINYGGTTVTRVLAAFEG